MGLEDSILLRCWFFLTSSIDSIQTQTPSKNFVAPEGLTTKFMWKCEGFRVANQNNFEREEYSSKILPDIKIYYKITLSNKAWHWHVPGCCHFSCIGLCDPMDPPGSSVHGDSPGKNTPGGCHALLQGIFPTHGLNLSLLWLLHCRQILYCWATGEALWPTPSTFLF